MKSASSSPGGFTLLEMLVATTVFAILVMLLSQITSVTSYNIGINSKKLDSAGQARVFFSRLAFDLTSRPRRSDLGMTFVKAKGNDSFRFYSGVGGYNANTKPRNFSLIEYRIQETGPGHVFQLERGATSFGWAKGDAQPLFRTHPLPFPNADDYDVFEPGIFRLEFSYILNTADPVNRVVNSAADDYSDVAAVVVAIAVIEAKQRALLTDDQVRELAAEFPDASDGKEPIVEWNAKLFQPGFASGLPKAAVQGIHLYQGVFYVR